MRIDRFRPYTLRASWQVGDVTLPDATVIYNGASTEDRHRDRNSGYAVDVLTVTDLLNRIETGSATPAEAKHSIQSLLDRTRPRSGCCIQCDEFQSDHAKAIVKYGEALRHHNQVLNARQDFEYLRDLRGIIHSTSCTAAAIDPPQPPRPLHDYGESHYYMDRVSVDPHSTNEWNPDNIRRLGHMKPKARSLELMSEADLLALAQDPKRQAINSTKRRRRKFEKPTVTFCRTCCPRIPEPLLPNRSFPDCWSWDQLDQQSSFRDRSQAVVDLFTWQDGRCALCGLHVVPLDLDHDHPSDLIRGFLCKSCNTTEGRNRTATSGIFAMYRQRNPATILGIELTYIDAKRNQELRAIRQRTQ